MIFTWYLAGVNKGEAVIFIFEKEMMSGKQYSWFIGLTREKLSGTLLLFSFFVRVELESSLPDGGSKNVLNMVIQNSIPISNLKKKANRNRKKLLKYDKMLARNQHSY